MTQFAPVQNLNRSVVARIATSGDDIYNVIRLKREFDAMFTNQTSTNFIVLGGAESHLVADELAEEDIAVILAPMRAPRSKFVWETRRQSSDTAKILARAGVRLGLAENVGEVEDVRNLRWELAKVVNTGFDRMTAIAAATSTLADIMGLEGAGRIAQGLDANLVLYSDDPLSMNGRVMLVAVRDIVSCDPLEASFDVDTAEWSFM